MGGHISRPVQLSAAIAFLLWALRRSRRQRAIPDGTIGKSPNADAANHTKRGASPFPTSGSGHRIDNIPPRPTRPVPGAPAVPAVIPPMPVRPPPRPPAESPVAGSPTVSSAGPPPRPTRSPPQAELAKFPGAADAASAELWICLDFEWTSDENTGDGRRVKPDEGEIIEFSFVVYDAVQKKSAGEGQYYCKNEKTPITEFCTKLTGISEQTLKGAGSLPDAIEKFNKVMEDLGAEKRSCCTVAHGSSDLELVLPANCRAHGIEVPKLLRRYVDLREATQTYLHQSGQYDVGRASSLKQICEALGVEMMGKEHCGLDDSWMVLHATQALLKKGAKMTSIDLDIEMDNFMEEGFSGIRLCLDGLPFFCLGSELRPWVEQHSSYALSEKDVHMVTGLQGMPSGRAVVKFTTSVAAQKALKCMTGGKNISCGDTTRWPFDLPTERHIVVRPIRWQEYELQEISITADTLKPGPGLVQFPENDTELDTIRSAGRRGRQPTEAQRGCHGEIKLWMQEKHYGFIRYEGGEVFFHSSKCHSSLEVKVGTAVAFDVLLDPKKKKTYASNVRKHVESN